MRWTETARREYRRDNHRYASDLTEREWAPIAPFLPPPKRPGASRRSRDLSTTGNHGRPVQSNWFIS